MSKRKSWPQLHLCLVFFRKTVESDSRLFDYENVCSSFFESPQNCYPVIAEILSPPDMMCPRCNSFYLPGQTLVVLGQMISATYNQPDSSTIGNGCTMPTRDRHLFRRASEGFVRTDGFFKFDRYIIAPGIKFSRCKRMSAGQLGTEEDSPRSFDAK